ncbi:divisome protein SepX/GlpR [Streptomonospora litoralis]|uniref:Uncharacterized protein n=1 Tax=Streptomonospora litoralis TaxID=2498135 RepID=A0A4P6Q9R8_9ACTN|nr:hypothetical protein [Streptomonospora litoralis]QBI55857.1 hypothetical protein EKD16_20485 [Streptomonospora litoralis]
MSSSPLYLAIVVVWLIVLVPMLLRRDSAVQYEDGAEIDGDLDAELDGDLDSDLDDDSAGEVGEYLRTGEHGGASQTAETGGTDGRTAGDGARDGLNARAEGDRGDAVPGVGGDRRQPEDPDRTRILFREEAEPPEIGEDEADVAYTESAPPGPVRRPRPSRAKVIARRRRRTTGLTALLALTGVGVGTGLGPWWVLVPPAVLLLGHVFLLREAAKADAERRAAEARHRRRMAEVRRARADEARAAREAEVIELMERRNQVYDQYADAHLRAAGD